MCMWLYLPKCMNPTRYFHMLPGGWLSPAICCFSCLILSWSNLRCSHFLSSKLERGMSDSEIRRTIPEIKWKKWGRNCMKWKTDKLICFASLKGYWEKRVSDIYPPPQEGARPTKDGVLLCLSLIYNPGTRLKQTLMQNIINVLITEVWDYLI